jgi:RNA polymerase sigma-70 factor (ECF subfamily)
MEGWMLEDRERLLERMDDAVNGLNAEQKACVTKFYLHQQSYQEIAATSGFTVLQVKSHIQNGKRNLKITLQKRQENEK